MRAARLLISVALLGGCGDGDTVANRTQPIAEARVTGPIAHDETASPTVVAPSPSRATEPKPLVSRGTRPPQTAPFDYRAIGTEPFWAVTVRGSSATLEQPDREPKRFAISRNDDGRTIRYLGDGFAMTLTQGPCSDGMSDAIWSDRVQVAFGEGTLKGCGGEREEGDWAP